MIETAVSVIVTRYLKNEVSCLYSISDVGWGEAGHVGAVAGAGGGTADGCGVVVISDKVMVDVHRRASKQLLVVPTFQRVERRSQNLVPRVIVDAPDHLWRDMAKDRDRSLL